MTPAAPAPDPTVPESSAAGPALSGAPRGPRPATAAKILDATRAALAESGFSALTVEAVAARSGVAKTTIYRHYRSRTDLALAVLTAMLEDVGSVPEREDVLAELAETVDRTIELLTTTLMGRIMKGLVSEVAQDPELAAVYRERVVARRVHDVRLILERGVASGRLREDLDAEELTDLLLGPIYYRFFLAGTNFGEDFGERLVARLRLT